MKHKINLCFPLYICRRSKCTVLPDYYDCLTSPGVKARPTFYCSVEKYHSFFISKVQHSIQQKNNAAALLPQSVTEFSFIFFKNFIYLRYIIINTQALYFRNITFPLSFNICLSGNKFLYPGLCTVDKRSLD